MIRKLTTVQSTIKNRLKYVSKLVSNSIYCGCKIFISALLKLFVIGKTYLWCLCGRSKSQPMCDGTHKFKELRIKLKYNRCIKFFNCYSQIIFRPIKFEVEETKDYWLCNCKQTVNRPFCDGTHKTKEVQDGSSIIRQ